MRKILITTVFTLLLTNTLQSQTLSKKEKIKALFEVMHQEASMMKMMDAMSENMVKYLKTMAPKEDSEFSQELDKLIKDQFESSKKIAQKLLNEDMVNIYDKYFSVEEIDDFITFYKTKSGQKMLSQMPEITKELMSVMTTKYQSDMQTTMMKFLEEIDKEKKKK